MYRRDGINAGRESGGVHGSSLRPAVLAVVSLILARFLLPYLAPLILGGLLAAVAHPLASALVRRGTSRPLAAALVLSLVGVLLAVVGVGIGSVFVGEARTLLSRLPGYLKELPALVRHLQPPLGPAVRGLFSGGHLEQLLPTMLGDSGQILTTSIALVRVVPDSALLLILSFTAAYFFLRDGALILYGLEAFAGERATLAGRSVVASVLGSAFRWLRGQLVLVGVTAAATTLALLVLRSPYAVLLGALTGLVDLVPYMGPGLLFLPWAGVELIGAHPGRMLEILATWLLVSAARQAVEARVLGGNLGVHPLVALGALYAGARLWGPVGVLWGPLLASVAVSLIRGETS